MSIAKIGKKLFLATMLTGILCSISFASDGSIEWVRSGERETKGIAVMTHGLNTKPAKMLDLARVLTSDGIDVVVVTLSGHSGNAENFKNVTRSLWVHDMERGYRAAREEADRKQKPLYLVGFSLGATIGIDHLVSGKYSNVRYDRIVMLAPALSLRSTSYFVNLLRVAGPRLTLPSLSHPDYRANAGGTTIAAYSSLFDSIREIGNHSLSPANVPSLVIVDPDDELVSPNGLRTLISSAELTQWKLIETTTGDTEISPSYHHLIIDAASLGARVWVNVSQSILSHLSGEAYPAPISLQQLCLTATRWQTRGNASCSRDWHSSCDRRTNACVKILER